MEILNRIKILANYHISILKRLFLHSFVITIFLGEILQIKDGIYLGKIVSLCVISGYLTSKLVCDYKKEYQERLDSSFYLLLFVFIVSILLFGVFGNLMNWDKTIMIIMASLTFSLFHNIKKEAY